MLKVTDFYMFSFFVYCKYLSFNTAKSSEDEKAEIIVKVDKFQWKQVASANKRDKL